VPFINETVAGLGLWIFVFVRLFPLSGYSDPSGFSRL